MTGTRKNSLHPPQEDPSRARHLRTGVLETSLTGKIPDRSHSRGALLTLAHSFVGSVRYAGASMAAGACGQACSDLGGLGSRAGF